MVGSQLCKDGFQPFFPGILLFRKPSKNPLVSPRNSWTPTETNHQKPRKKQPVYNRNGWKPTETNKKNNSQKKQLVSLRNGPLETESIRQERVGRPRQAQANLTEIATRLLVGGAITDAVHCLSGQRNKRAMGIDV